VEVALGEIHRIKHLATRYLATMEESKSALGRSFLKNAYFGYGAQGFKLGLGFASMIIFMAVADIQVYGMVALLTSI